MAHSGEAGIARARMKVVGFVGKILEWPWTKRLLGHDDPLTFGAVIGAVGMFWLLDRLTRSAASLAPEDRFESFLAGGAIFGNSLAVAAVALCVLVAAARGRSEIMAPWSALSHGVALRAIATPLLVFVVWYGALYDYNFLLGQWHTADRLLVVLFALAAWYRPVFLILVVLQARIVGDQFLEPLDAASGRNIGDLLVMALLAIAATFLFTTITRRTDTSPALLLMYAALAAHFFIPGRGKIGLDWITRNEVKNFPLNAYTAGWRGDGDGGLARDLASLADTFRLPLLLGTLVLEFAAIVAVLHRGLLRFWLAGWILFHSAVFVMSGFFLIQWVVLEAVLLIVVLRRDLREWVTTNHTPARSLLAATLVVLGATFFQPQELRWIDSPVGYGYQIEVVTESGERYNVAPQDLEPLQENLGLGFAQFRDAPLLINGYGAISWMPVLAQLEESKTFDDLHAVQSAFTVPEETRQASELLIVSWFSYANDGGPAGWSKLAPPSLTWTSLPSPKYDYSEPLRSAEVFLVLSLIDGLEQQFSRQSVLTVVADEDGRPVVTARGGEPSDS